MKVEKAGRRWYFVDSPYSLKEQLKEEGCRWDPDRRQWWTGKQEVADRVMRFYASVGSSNQGGAGKPKSPTVSRDDPLLGKVRYQAKTGRVGTWYWVRSTRDGSRYLLANLDASRAFWADASRCTVIKRYDGGRDGRSRPTLSSIASYINSQKRRVAGLRRADLPRAWLQYAGGSG